MAQSETDWSRTKVVVAVSLLCALATCVGTILLVPEVRRFLKLDPVPQHSSQQSNQETTPIRPSPGPLPTPDRGSNIAKDALESRGVWLGFANETVSQDRERELRKNCGQFNRISVPVNAGNTFVELCNRDGKTCDRVCDWQGTIFPCTTLSLGGRRDGTRVALCR